MTVVLGYVERPEAGAALDEALSVVRRSGERLVVVSAPGPGSASAPRSSGSGIAAVEDRLTREAVPHTVVGPGRGSQPADALREAVIANRAGLLVIGMRAGAVLGRLLPGATTQAILLDPPCDVLVVKAPTR